jgi:hypothetical protein
MELIGGMSKLEDLNCGHGVEDLPAIRPVTKYKGLPKRIGRPLVL